MLRHDLATALRTVRRRGSLPIVVILMLAVAIGAVTAVYSIAHAVLLRPLPMDDPNRVFLLWGRDDSRSQSVVEVSLEDLYAWRAGQHSLESIEVFGSVNWGELHITGPGEPFDPSMSAVSAGFFDVLGATPMLGRTFRPEDDRPNAPGTVILSAGTWRRHFGADPAVVGKALTVGRGKDATIVEVIGVMPSDFRVPAGAEVWVPIIPHLTAASEDQKWPVENVRAMYGIGRLQDGRTREGAVAELSTIARNEEVKRGLKDSAMVVVATPLVGHLLGPARPALLAIAGAAIMLLLVGCANAAGLLLVQSAGRRREVAVRLALGAQRWQIVRERLVESLLMSGAAALLGVSIAFLSFDAIVALAPMEVPRLDEAAIDGRALGFALCVALAAAIAVGLLPAWQHSAAGLVSGLYQRSDSGATQAASARVRRVLVAGQIALAVVLLTGAGLFARSFVALLRLDLGFEPRHALTFELNVPDGSYVANAQRWALTEAVIESAGRLPTAVAAGAVFLRPFEHGPIGMDSYIVLEGQPLTPEGMKRNPIVNWEVATPGYFRAMGIRVIRGRVFERSDHERAPLVAIVSEALAARLWPGQDPIGRRLIASYAAGGDEKNPGWQTVIGVVADARYREIEAPRFDLYIPYRQAPNHVEHFVVRVSGDPMAVVPELQAAVAAIDPGIEVAGITTMDRIVGRVMGPWRFSTIVVSAFSVIALAFAAVGLAALIAYAVAQRTREIGVRMALGAQRLDVLRLLLTEGVVMTIAGLAAGTALAWPVRRTVASMLFGVSPDDAATLGGVALVLCAVAAIAAYFPARRAVRIDPAVTLRGE